MREPIRDKGRLEHILEAINFVKLFTAGYDCESFQRDTLRFHATVHNIQVIGEAVYKLSSQFKAGHQLTEWDTIEKMRHILVHDYYRIDERLLWNIITMDIPVLESQIIYYLSEFR